MSEPPLLPALVCQRCGATNPPNATECWLCKRGGTTNPYASARPMQAVGEAHGSAAGSSQSRTEIFFAALLVAALALALIVGIGLSVQEPGTLIPYLIIIAPPFLATAGRGLLSVGRKEQPKPSKLFLTFLWSSLFTALALVLMVVASVIALFVWCISLLTSMGGH